MKFKINTLSVPLDKLTEGGNRRLWFEAGKPFVPFAAAPMINSIRDKEHISKSEFGFCEIPSDKIGVFSCKLLVKKFFLGIKKAGAAIHQQSRSLMQRYAVSGTMMVARTKTTLVTKHAIVR